MDLSKVVKFESALFSNPEGRSFNCMIPMPFKKAAKVMITNESKMDIPEIFFDIDFMRLDKLEDRCPVFPCFLDASEDFRTGSGF